MADNLGIRNYEKFAGEPDFITILTTGPADYNLNSITLPNIVGATIKRVRIVLHLLVIFPSGSPSATLSADMNVQVKESVSGSWTTGITIYTNQIRAFDANTDSAVFSGSIDVSSEVSSFNKTYDFRLNNADTLGFSLISTIIPELEIWYELDSGVELKIDTVDGIVDDIKESIIVGSGTVTLLGSQTVFQTDLTDADDFWNSLQILMISGNNAGQARRISDFVNVNGVVTVSDGFKNNVALNDTFILIGRYTGAGTSLTDASIADAVLRESVDDHKGVANSLAEHIDATQVDTDEIQGKLPSSSYLKGTADSDGGFDTTDKADLQQEATDALNAYDPPTRTEATTDKDEIITEVNANETKIDTVITDLGTHDTDIKALIGTPSVDVSADIANIDSDLATHDTDIKTLIGSPSPDLVTDIQTAESNIRGSDSDDLKDLSDQMDNLSAQIGTIQNNVFFSTTVLPSYERPASGSSIIKIIAQVFDATGNPEDPDSNELKIKLDGSVTGNLISQTLMTRDAQGVYSYLYTILSTDNLENWEFEFYYKEATVDKYHYRNSRLQDFSDDLDDIRTKVNANYVKLDSATPSPTLPAQITTHDTDIKVDIATHDTDIKADIATHDTDIKALPRIEACPDLMYVPTGRTQIDIDGGISDIDNEIQVSIAANLLTTGLVKIGSEYIIYDGITDSKLQVTQRGAYGTAAVAHNNSVVVSQSILYPIRLVVFDNAGNMKNADTPPTLEIEDWKGTQELAPTAMTVIGTGIYGYNYIIDHGEVPENKLFKFSATVDAKVRELRHEVVIIDQPASSSELVEYLGGGLGDFVIDQDGWYDSDGVKTLWTDEMKGYIRDVDTGAPLDDAYVTAYLYENNETKYNGRPPGQSRTRPNGTYLMFLDAGTYTFVAQKDGFRVVGGGIQNRTVD